MKLLVIIQNGRLNSGNTNREFKKNAFHNIGLSYIHLKDYSSAKQYFDKEFSLIKKVDTSSIIRAKMELANVYYNQYLDDDAIPLFLESYNLSKIFFRCGIKTKFCFKHGGCRT